MARLARTAVELEGHTLNRRVQVYDLSQNSFFDTHFFEVMREETFICTAAAVAAAVLL
jgi:hypothetical protein